MNAPNTPAFRTLRADMEATLAQILTFWLDHAIDHKHGGFVGHMDANRAVDEEAPKGLVLHARLLWFFSAAYRRTAAPACEAAARRAFAALQDHFYDPVHKGYVWSVTPDGQPLDASKKLYGQAFALYGLAEYFRASAEPAAQSALEELLTTLETRAKDLTSGGYNEAFDRAWSLLDDQRLGAGDTNAPRSMNAHLHLLEAYTQVRRALPHHPRIGPALEQLVECFLTRIYNPEGQHLWLFLDRSWSPLDSRVSFGHDIEASWLLREARPLLSSPALQDAVTQTSHALLSSVFQRGRADNGALWNEAKDATIVDTDHHWWVQAEAVVGFLGGYLELERDEFLDAALQAWAYIRDNLLDGDPPAWLWMRRQDGTTDASRPLISAWKGPYHNGRMCLEVLKQTDPLS